MGNSLENVETQWETQWHHVAATAAIEAAAAADAIDGICIWTAI